MNETPNARMSFALLLCLSSICVACATPGADATATAPAASAELSPAPHAAATATPDNASPYGEPVRLAVLADKRIDESSGIVASRADPDLFWTHNDSGANLFLIDQRGRTRATFVVPGIDPFDWEDIAAAPGRDGTNYLYLGDIGDNSANRREIVVYRVPEPVLPPDAPPDAGRAGARRTALPEAFRLRYPDGARDAETLLVHPATGDLYVITKRLLAPAEVYRARAPLDSRRTTVLERVALLDIPSLTGGALTGGDVSPDGRRVILCDYFAGYELILPERARSFDDIWRERPRVVRLDARRLGEGICYRLDGRAILTTSEGLPTPLGEVERRR